MLEILSSQGRTYYKPKGERRRLNHYANADTAQLLKRHRDPPVDAKP
jgi:hypothetical protein